MKFTVDPSSMAMVSEKDCGDPYVDKATPIGPFTTIAGSKVQFNCVNGYSLGKTDDI